MNGTDFLLDTNIILGFLQGQRKIIDFYQTQLKSQALFVSQITRMELLGHPGITSEEESVISEFLSLVEIVPVSKAVEDRAIAVRKKEHIKLPDAIILATAIEHGYTLITCDREMSKKASLDCKIEIP